METSNPGGPILQFPIGLVGGNIASPAAWADLDLSAIVGARICDVRLSLRKVTHVGNSTLCVRYNGDTRLYQNGGHDSEARVNNIAAADDIIMCCQTDGNGVIEWIDSVAGESWSVLVYRFATP